MQARQTPGSARPARPGTRAIAWLAAGVALAATLLLYRHPDFLLQLSQHLWFCFQ